MSIRSSIRRLEDVAWRMSIRRLIDVFVLSGLNNLLYVSADADMRAFDALVIVNKKSELLLMRRTRA